VKKVILISCILIFTLNSIIAQAKTNLHYEVNVNHAPLSISLEQLQNAQSLSDLNRMFRPAWYREYLSVEISTVQDNQLVSVLGNSDTLNNQQKSFLKGLIFPAPITVSIDYIPENDLEENPPRNESFTFSIHPVKEAEYIGGHASLNNYLKEKAISHIPEGTFVGYDLAIVKFVINEKGQVVDVEVSQSSKDDSVDKLIYETVCNMPDWNPAQHTDGKKLRQEFALTIGNHENCMINLLNTVNNKY